jgi:hypothetical protein
VLEVDGVRGTATCREYSHPGSPGR